MRFKDFKQLSKNKPKNRFWEQSQTTQPEASGPSPEDEEQIFRQAMQDVQPLQDNGRGRKVLPKNQQKKQGSDTPKTLLQSPREYLQDLVQGKVDFHIEYSEEYLQGNVRGLDPRIMRKLKSGELSPEAHLDLHGQTLEQAKASLISFIRDHYLNGRRCLLIIPGRGKNSPQGRSVIREHIQPWLTQDPLKRVVLGFSTAKSLHGGTGALYILLRKYKKSRGKIFWQRWEQEQGS
ncbi:MAG: Smr/MutS family protein [Thermodesulfobacteriota bacterium]